MKPCMFPRELGRDSPETPNLINLYLLVSGAAWSRTYPFAGYALALPPRPGCPYLPGWAVPTRPGLHPWVALFRQAKPVST